MEEEEKKNMTLCEPSSFDNLAILMGCTFFGKCYIVSRI
jgi:hypothetical protein